MALTHSLAISVTEGKSLLRWLNGRRILIYVSKHLAIRRETPSILFISWQIEL